jgi:hypothetical protein
MSWCRAHFVDVWPDIASFSRVLSWLLDIRGSSYNSWHDIPLMKYYLSVVFQESNATGFNTSILPSREQPFDAELIEDNGRSVQWAPGWWRFPSRYVRISGSVWLWSTQTLDLLQVCWQVILCSLLTALYGPRALACFVLFASYLNLFNSHKSFCSSSIQLFMGVLSAPVPN